METGHYTRHYGERRNPPTFLTAGVFQIPSSFFKLQAETGL